MAIPMRKAAWRVTLNGTDLTSVLGPRLIMLTLEEKRGDEADQIDIEINDADGKVDLPPKGATLRVFMGWEKGEDVLTGLIDKGTFRIDEVRWISGADKIILRGRSADFTSAFRKRRDRSFVGKTVAEVIGTIATANGLKAQVHPDLASKIVPPLGSGPRSDSALLKDLGKRFDATATVKAGNLLFSPIGKGQTASGITLPPETIARAACPPSGIDYERSERATYTGVEAQWHDKATAQRQTVVAGSDTNAKRLKKIYASEALRFRLRRPNGAAPAAPGPN
jgi:hypothetical protein